MAPKTHLVLGGPGTGKTHRLLSIVDEHLSAGVPPERIAYVSFTKKAAREAVSRAAKRFNLPRRRLCHFRTLHSLAYMALGLSRDQVFGAKGTNHWRDLAEATCCRFKKHQESPYDGTKGDRALFLDGYARTTGRSLYKAWALFGEKLEWRWVEWFSATIRAYKQENLLFDFTDMLERYLAECAPLDVDVAVVDEAQDLSLLQWQTVQRAFSTARRLYVGGDSDQALFLWSGADLDTFLSLEHDTQEVLPVSRRLAPEVHTYARTVANRIQRRYENDFAPSPGKEGRVLRHRYPNSIPLELPGSWMLLARNHRFLPTWEKLARDKGVLYRKNTASSVDKKHTDAIMDFERLRKGGTIPGTRADVVMRLAGEEPRFEGREAVTLTDTGLPNKIWHRVFEGIAFPQREYYKAMLKRGVEVRAKPEVLISTIHAVKGGEADRVAVLSDVAPKTYTTLRKSPDDEWRVWYTAVTRTRGDLHIVLPQTNRSYPI